MEVEVDVGVDVAPEVEPKSFETVQRSEFLTQDPSEHLLQLRGAANAAPGKRIAPAPMRSRLRRVVSMIPPLEVGELLSPGNLTWKFD